MPHYLENKKCSTIQNKHPEVHGENKINFYSKAKFCNSNPFYL